MVGGLYRVCEPNKLARQPQTAITSHKAITFQIFALSVGKDGAGGGGRTPTPLREPDFESGASASSATPASLRTATQPRGNPARVNAQFRMTGGRGSTRASPVRINITIRKVENTSCNTIKTGHVVPEPFRRPVDYFEASSDLRVCSYKAQYRQDAGVSQG